MLVENLVASANKEISRYSTTSPAFLHFDAANWFFSNFLLGSLCGLSQVECFKKWGVSSALVMLGTFGNKNTLASLKISIAKQKTKVVKVYNIDFLPSSVTIDDDDYMIDLDLYDEIIRRQTSVYQNHTMEVFSIKVVDEKHRSSGFKIRKMHAVTKLANPHFTKFRSQLRNRSMSSSLQENRLKILCQTMRPLGVSDVFDEINRRTFRHQHHFQHTASTLVQRTFLLYARLMRRYHVTSIDFRSTFAFFHGLFQARQMVKEGSDGLLTVTGHYLSDNNQMINLMKTSAADSDSGNTWPLLISFKAKQPFEHPSVEDLQNMPIWNDVFVAEFRQVGKKVEQTLGWIYVPQPDLISEKFATSPWQNDEKFCKKLGMVLTMSCCLNGSAQQVIVESVMLGSLLSYKKFNDLQFTENDSSVLETRAEFNLDQKFSITSCLEFYRKITTRSVLLDTWYALKQIVSHCRIQNVNLYAFVTGFFNDYYFSVQKTKSYNIFILDDLRIEERYVVQIQHSAESNTNVSGHTLGKYVATFQAQFLADVYADAEFETCCSLILALFIGNPIIDALIVERSDLRLSDACNISSEQNYKKEVQHETLVSGVEITMQTITPIFSSKHIFLETQQQTVDNQLIKSMSSRYNSSFLEHLVETYDSLTRRHIEAVTTDAPIITENKLFVSADISSSILQNIMKNVNTDNDSMPDIQISCIVKNLIKSIPKREDSYNGNIFLTSLISKMNSESTLNKTVLTNLIPKFTNVRYIQNNIDADIVDFVQEKSLFNKPYSYSGIQTIVLDQVTNDRSILMSMLFVMDHYKFNAYFRSPTNLNQVTDRSDTRNSFIDINKPLDEYSKQNDQIQIHQNKSDCNVFFHTDLISFSSSSSLIPYKIADCMNFLGLTYSQYGLFNKSRSHIRTLFETADYTNRNDTIYADSETPSVFLIRNSGFKSIRGSKFSDQFLITQAQYLEGEIDGMDGDDSAEFANNEHVQSDTTSKTVLTIGNYWSKLTTVTKERKKSTHLYLYNIDQYIIGENSDVELVNIETCDMDSLRVFSAKIQFKMVASCVFFFSLEIRDTATIKISSKLGQITYILHQTTTNVFVDVVHETASINQTFHLTEHTLTDLKSFSILNSTFLCASIGTTEIQIHHPAISKLVFRLKFSDSVFLIVYNEYSHAYLSGKLAKTTSVIIDQVAPVAYEISVPILVQSLPDSSVVIFEPGSSKLTQNSVFLSYFVINQNFWHKTIIVTSPASDTDRIFQITDHVSLLECKTTLLTIYHHETATETRRNILDVSKIINQILHNMEKLTKINLQYFVNKNHTENHLQITLAMMEESHNENVQISTPSCTIMQIFIKNVSLHCLFHSWLIILDTEYKFVQSAVTSNRLIIAPLAYQVEKSRHLLIEAKSYMRFNVSEIGQDLAIFWMNDDLVITTMEEIEAPIILIRHAGLIEKMKIDFLAQDSTVSISPEDIAEEIIAPSE